MRALRAALGVAFVLAWLGGAPSGRPAHAEEILFEELAWPKGALIVDSAALDLDQDGHKDFILVRGREAQIHLMTKDGRYRPDRPDQRFRFVEHAILWTYADIEGDPRPELLYLAKDGVYAYRWQGGRLSFVPRLVLATKSILKSASREEVRLKSFYQDMDGDGVRDFILPGDACFLLHRGRKDGSFLPAESLYVRPDVFIGLDDRQPTDLARSSFWFPTPVAGDFDGDGRQDILCHQRHQVVVFSQEEVRLADGSRGLRFRDSPSRVLPLGFEGDLPEGRLKLDFELPTDLADLDGDGLTDIIATHVGRAQTKVFRGRKGGRTLESPDVLLQLPGITFLELLTDLDQDGLTDLVLCRTERPGLWDIVKVLLTKEVPIELLVFFGRKEGGTLFPKAPDMAREMEIPILFSSQKRGLTVGTSAVISVLGDVTGDGRKDLILRSGDDTLAVFPGAGRGFAEDPAFELSVAPMDGYRFIEPVLEDLNGDGVDDIVLTYYSWEGTEDRVSVLLSRRPKK